MKLEPPVPVPVDSILSWGCGAVGSGGGPDDDDDLLSGKFNACDMADSTTGSSLHEHLNSNHHHHHQQQQQSSAMAATSSDLMSCSGGTSSGGGHANSKTSLLSLDNLDNLLLSGATVLTTPTTPGPGPGGGHSFAELKPLALPPFDGYGSSNSANVTLDGSMGMGNGGTRTILDINLNLYKANGNNNNNNNNSSGTNNLNYYPGGGGSSANEPVSTTTLVNGLVGVVKADNMAEYLMNPEIDDIAAIIGNAIADSTVASGSGSSGGAHQQHQHQHHQHQVNLAGGGVANVAGVGLGGVESLGPDIRDPWADIDAWIESACGPTVYKHEPMLESPASVASVTSHSSLSSVSPAFVHPSLPPISSIQQQSGQQQQQHNSSCSVSSTLQALLSQGAAQAGSVALAHMGQDNGGNAVSIAVKSEPSMDMPLLQRRLTAGREPNSMSTSSGGNSNNNNNSSSNSGIGGFVSCSMASKEMQLPHTTFHTGPGMNHVSTSLPHLGGGGGGGGDSGCHSSGYPATARRSTAIKSTSYSNKDMGSDLDDNPGGGGIGGGGGSMGSGSSSGGRSKHKNRSTKAKMTTVMTTDGAGKEKPVHRCNICNRGFLNKSNIKVHLRTHTGEKPFKCDACAKAFRQKAHLLKHMQIHKRITRD